MTLDRILRDLALSGMVPRVAPGKRSPHYTLHHLTNVFMALSAAVPSEAAEAVRTMTGLKAKELNALFSVGATTETKLVVPPGHLFSAWVSSSIESWANPTFEMLGSVGDESQGRYWVVVSMSPGRAHAYVQEWAPGSGSRLTHFEPEEKLSQMPKLAARRSLDLTGLAFQAFGELLADTLAREPTLISDPAPASAVEDATPEKMKATGPASHGDLLSDVPATRAYPALAPAVTEQSQSATKEGSKQSASPSKGRESRVRQHRTTRTRHNGTFWTDSASP